MEVTRRVLNRTLLARQHLLERVGADHPLADPVAMAEHLVGLQAQEALPPYLSWAARIDGFDPRAASAALAGRRVLRLLLMRGTIHTVTPADARLLRPLVQPMLDKVSRSSAASRPAAHVPLADVVGAGRALLAARGPLPVGVLGAALAERFPDAPATALVNRLREAVPLVQVPPRGLWARSGGVVYETLETWLGDAVPVVRPDPGTDAPDPGADAPGPSGEAAEHAAAAHGAALADVVRRYLRAFGPATPADVTTWSGITGARAVLDGLGDEVVTYRDDDGRAVWDLAAMSLTDPDTPAPPRLLGRYDNVWLSHAARDRVTPAEVRGRWMGANGGVGCVVLVDGQLRGLWQRTPAGGVDVELFAPLARAERAALDDEVARARELLAVPADGPS